MKIEGGYNNATASRGIVISEKNLEPNLCHRKPCPCPKGACLILKFAVETDEADAKTDSSQDR